MVRTLSEQVEHYLELARKYLRESEELLAEKEYTQASEKLWGAAAEIVKTVAAKRGIELKTHRELWQFVAHLHTELKDPEVSRLFTVANYLHQNFYEAIMPPEAVGEGAEAVKLLVGKLEKLL